MINVLESPMQGIIKSVYVKVGDEVKEGDLLCLLEAMKMLTPVESSVNGKIAAIYVVEKQPVGRGEKLIEIEY